MISSPHSVKILNHLACTRVSRRYMGTDAPLRRSYLYVPASSDRMLEKSFSSTSDMIIYDLEDSVSPSPADKTKARKRLTDFLRVCSRGCRAVACCNKFTSKQQQNLPDSQRIAVRVNDINTPFFYEDVAQIVNTPMLAHFV